MPTFFFFFIVCILWQLQNQINCMLHGYRGTRNANSRAGSLGGNIAVLSTSKFDKARPLVWLGPRFRYCTYVQLLKPPVRKCKNSLRTHTRAFAFFNPFVQGHPLLGETRERAFRGAPHAAAGRTACTCALRAKCGIYRLLLWQRAQNLTWCWHCKFAYVTVQCVWRKVFRITLCKSLAVIARHRANCSKE